MMVQLCIIGNVYFLLKMFNISFDFNPTTKKITNISIKEVGVNNIDEPCEIQLLSNKLQLTDGAMGKLNLLPDDRVSVEYIMEGVGKSSPVIGKSEMFTDALNGNKVNKNGTVSFRGEKNNTLKQFGSLFKLAPYKDGIWKLEQVEINEDAEIASEEHILEEINNNEIDLEINSLTNYDDDLPF